jgi:hypothetical protein
MPCVSFIEAVYGLYYLRIRMGQRVWRYRSMKSSFPLARE